MRPAQHRLRPVLSAWPARSRPQPAAPQPGADRTGRGPEIGALNPVTWKNLVSEGGLEPPCPFGALAPQASASAYSATRTWVAATTPKGRRRAGHHTNAGLV